MDEAVDGGEVVVAGGGAPPEQVDVSDLAYTKLMYHTIQHPHAAVCGFLLGKQRDERRLVTDAIPLFHTPVMAPLLEQASLMVQVYLSQLEAGTVIVGLYCANAALDDSQVPDIVCRMAEQVESKYPGVAVLQVNNKRLENPSEHALLAFAKDSGKTFRRGIEVEVSSTARGVLSSAVLAPSLSSKTRVSDFDDHFGDVTKDWRNLGISVAQ